MNVMQCASQIILARTCRTVVIFPHWTDFTCCFWLSCLPIRLWDVMVNPCFITYQRNKNLFFRLNSSKYRSESSSLCFCSTVRTSAITPIWKQFSRTKYYIATIGCLLGIRYLLQLHFTVVQYNFNDFWGIPSVQQFYGEVTQQTMDDCNISSSGSTGRGPPTLHWLFSME